MHLRELHAYLKGLEENNNKAWFVMSKPSYDILRAEFVELVGEVIAGVARFDKSLAGIDAKKALFRIHRDVRFSKDKSPYKTTFSAALGRSGAKVGGAMYYFHIDANNKLLVGTGCWHPSDAMLATIRRTLAADARPLQRIVRARAFVSTYGGLSDEEALARAPKGYAPDHPAIEFIKQRNFIGVANIALTARNARNLVDTIVEPCRVGYPLVRWLREVEATVPRVDES
jgi:uncharacterized protein (TIGR02453 family)